MHKVVHSEERPFICDICNKGFKLVYALKLHVERHKGRRFFCEVEGCGAGYTEAISLRKHTEMMHIETEPKYKCTWADCTYATSRLDLMKRHTTKHTGERPFLCIWPDCEKAFKTRSNHREHMLTHKNDRSYKCKWSMCEYSCNNSGNLRKHEAIHERKAAKQLDPTIHRKSCNLKSFSSS